MSTELIKLQHSDRDHFINGGSSIERRKRCRGSLKMEKPFWNIRDDTEDSIEGTLVHEVGEILIPFPLANWDNKEDKFAGAPDLDEYEERIVEAGERYCLDILRIIGNKVPKIAWVAEQRFTINEELELGGTADFAWGYIQKTDDFIMEHSEIFADLCKQLVAKVKDLKVGHIWDYKNGTIPHDARTSDQIRQYIAGLQHKLGSNGKRPFDVIFGHIYGPNFRDQSLVTSVVAYTKEQIEEILQEQILIAEEALGLHGDGPLKLHAGDHCFWCKAKAVCSEFDRFSREKATNVIETWDRVEANKKENESLVPAVIPNFTEILETRTDEQIKDFFLHIEYLSKGIEAVKQYIRNRHLQGKPIKGLKVVSGEGRRIYKKSLDDKTIGEKLQTCGVEKPWKKVVRNITEVEKEIYKDLRDKKVSVEDAKKQAAALMDIVCEKSTPHLKIVLDSENDSRPGIEIVNGKKATELLDANPVSN